MAPTRIVAIGLPLLDFLTNLFHIRNVSPPQLENKSSRPTGYGGLSEIELHCINKLLVQLNIVKVDRDGVVDKSVPVCVGPGLHNYDACMYNGKCFMVQASEVVQDEALLAEIVFGAGALELLEQTNGPMDRINDQKSVMTGLYSRLHSLRAGSPTFRKLKMGWNLWHRSAELIKQALGDQTWYAEGSQHRAWYPEGSLRRGNGPAIASGARIETPEATAQYLEVKDVIDSLESKIGMYLKL